MESGRWELGDKDMGHGGLLWVKPTPGDRDWHKQVDLPSGAQAPTVSKNELSFELRTAARRCELTVSKK
jgi:hypothetical protein